ncbi:hypothetical protein DRW07_02150 [Alteromonas sediminis]|uniref:DUF3987 domain-containing protein n=1 Tax=Alteromonas sediminis TaxID=2259342 RepID=A0A3N5Y318_9ALTE|nr:hypothetical protein [Alteromonas sediminis]RPJ68232.1 hypothetical protein DRW07_02150 [Alteromonas sediminis]
MEAIIDILHLAKVKVAPVKENYSISQPWYFPRIAEGRKGGYYSASYETGHPFHVPEEHVHPLQQPKQPYKTQQGESVIHSYCERFPLRGELHKRGFKYVRDDRYLPPESTSGIAGAIILTSERDGRERLYVHNSSSPYYGKANDSFDLFCIDEHRGDYKEAVKAAAELLGLSASEDAFALFLETQEEEPPSNESLPVDISSVILEKPPGLAGLICDHLLRTANRPTPLIYPLVALQAISLAAGDKMGINGIKLNLLTLAIAPSAAGKEHGQAWLAKTAANLKLGRRIAGGISSDVDMIRNLIEADGRCCYRIDEIQGLFNAIKSKNANTYESKIGDLILTLATSHVFMFSGNHRRQFLREIDHDIEQLKKRIGKAKDAKKGDTALEDETVNIENLNGLLRWLFKKRGYIENGWPNPIVSIMGHSTPTGLDSLVTEENIGTGLIGRCIVIRCAEMREKLQRAKKRDFFFDYRVENRLRDIKDNIESELKTTPEALQMLEAIQVYYDEDERLNAPVMGAIYARVMEQVQKVASLLALEEGTVTVEHVAYAFALVSRCTEDIAFLVQKDTALKADASIAEIANYARESIKRQLKLPQGKTPSQLKQVVLKCFKPLKKLVEKQRARASDKADTFDLIIQRMVEIGDIELIKDGRKTRYILKKK